MGSDGCARAGGRPKQALASDEDIKIDCFFFFRRREYCKYNSKVYVALKVDGFFVSGHACFFEGLAQCLEDGGTSI
jgi:hypothetical protein